MISTPATPSAAQTWPLCHSFRELLIMKRDWKPHAGFNDLFGILAWRMRIERKITKCQLWIRRYWQTLWKQQGLHQHNQDQTGKLQNKAELLPLHLGNRLWQTQQGVKLYFLNHPPSTKNWQWHQSTEHPADLKHCPGLRKKKPEKKVRGEQISQVLLVIF